MSVWKKGPSTSEASEAPDVAEAPKNAAERTAEHTADRTAGRAAGRTA